MRLVHLSLTALLSVFESGWVQAQSLPEAVAIALSQYPTILAAQANQQAAEYEVTRAQGAYWPQVSWTGTYNYYNTGTVVGADPILTTCADPKLTRGFC